MSLVYNDAEKGTLDVRSPQLAAIPEKKPTDLDVFPVQSLKKDAPVPQSNVAKPPPAKPQKLNISKYVYFIVWYNAYRSVQRSRSSTSSLISL